MFKNKKLILSFLLFLSLNLGLYLFIFKFNYFFPFQQYNYTTNSHHYLEDPRVNGKPFSFLRALGQQDAQWYLKIASKGYPKDPKITDMEDKTVMDGLTYAFFPFYPMLISLINQIFKNVELSAFLLTNILMIANFFSFYFVAKKLFNEKTALKTIFLIFLFPFSIFFRSYFPEGLMIFLLLWFGYFLIKKNFLLSAAFLAILNIIKGNILGLNFLYLFYLIKEFRKKRISYAQLCSYIFILVFPMFCWLAFNFYQTGNALYFFAIRSQWFPTSTFLSPIIHNLELLFLFPLLPLHSFHYSQIDLLLAVLSGVLLFVSYKSFDRKLWWIGFLVWLTPLIVSDTMSFSRYQIVSYSLFLYLAIKLSDKMFYFILLIFGLLLMITALLFINWYWIG